MPHRNDYTSWGEDERQGPPCHIKANQIAGKAHASSFAMTPVTRVAILRVDHDQPTFEEAKAMTAGS